MSLDLAAMIAHAPPAPACSCDGCSALGPQFHPAVNGLTVTARCHEAQGRLIGWQWTRTDAKPHWCPRAAR